jgi:hypothetical protein
MGHHEGWAQRSAAQRTALSALETIVTAAWMAAHKVAPSAQDLTDMARSFHVARFAMDEGDTDWREASTLLGRHLYGSDAAGDAPLRDLRGIMRDLIGSGAPADRDGLLRALRRRGHLDVGAPRYDGDIARLRAVTASELERLAVHGELPLAGGVAIERESDAPMLAAIKAGSVLVVGEPGAGKTGALVHAARSLIAEGALVVFLSVDRFPGVAIAADLNSELRLDHDLVEILSSSAGSQPRFLIIDALDAARGGLSEGVFATLIERAVGELSDDWTVVASIRTFDLRNGRRYRAAFAGAPADAAYAESTLGTIRHFTVPRLTDSDLAAAGTASAEVAALLACATEALAELLRNVFNLSLAAELLADGADPAGFAGIATQSGLIDIYEDRRMPTTGMTQAAAEAVTAMGHLDCHGHAIEDHDLMAPVELVGLARIEAQRDISAGRRLPCCLRPTGRVSAHGVIAAIIAPVAQLLVDPDQRQSVALRSPRILGQHVVQFGPPGIDLRTRLRGAVIGELGRPRSNDLAHRVPRQPQLSADLLDRLAFDEMRPPDLRYRLHNQHPLIAPSRSRGSF